ncbi:MAG: adenylosuccinate synthase [Bdellovibrionales bacterium]|nr:adenylosuccinate synthase [Bdellovibrionales bacterium]
MQNIVLVGTQWGDEGKGKIVDYLSEKADYVVRFQGGNNAGHTVIIGDQKIVLHFIPSGILRQNTVCMIGNGVVVNIKALFEEVKMLQKLGFQVTPENLRISENAHLILPYHIYMDILAEKNRGDQKIGTTAKGIGPAYADKISRTGIRMSHLRDMKDFEQRVRYNIEQKNTLIAHLYKDEVIEYQYVHDEIIEFRDWVLPFLTNVSTELRQAHHKGKKVLFEGAQGTSLDIDHGTYPFVTSSNTVAGGACVGAGVGPTMIDGVIGVCKAYTTRVGSGPFPTELMDEVGKAIAQKGQEFGATTGRPRRCGWLDGVFLSHAVWVNGVTDLAMTKLDVLSGFETIKIATSYRYPTGVTSNAFVSENDVLEKVEPVYEELSGWEVIPKDCTSLAQMPQTVQKFLSRVEEIAGTRVSLLSTGPDRRDQIVIHDFF